MNQLLAIAITALIATFSTSVVAQEKVRVTGLYSNMKFGTEDVTGVEVFLVYSRDGHYAIVQCAEGEPGKPFVAKANVNKNAIEFEVPSNSDSLCPKGMFRGTVSSKGLRGKFEQMDWPGFLPRKKSYWQ
jgi:hypothetical protein